MTAAVRPSSCPTCGSTDPQRLCLVGPDADDLYEWMDDPWHDVVADTPAPTNERD